MSEVPALHLLLLSSPPVQYITLHSPIIADLSTNKKKTQMIGETRSDPNDWEGVSATFPSDCAWSHFSNFSVRAMLLLMT